MPHLLFRWPLLPRSPTSLAQVEGIVDRRYPEVRHLSVDDIRRRDGPLRFIDVRDPDEFGVSHLPGAEHRSREASLPSHPGLTVVYCSVGERSAAAVARWQKEGGAGIVNLRGGIFRWAIEGHSLEDGATTVHGFNDAWGQLLPPSLLAR